MTQANTTADRRFIVRGRNSRKPATFVRETKGNIFLLVDGEVICFSKLTRCKRGTSPHDFYPCVFSEA